MGFRLANVADRAVLVEGDEYFDVAELSDELSAELGDGRLGPDPMQAIAAPGVLADLSAALRSIGRVPTGSIRDVVLGPPVPRPQKVFAIGLNYDAHAKENGRDPSTSPVVFTKFPSCLVGPTHDVEMRGDGCDYEVELVVVIGRGGKDIAPERAWDHVVGVMAGQDISDRPAQMAATPPHFSLGKSFDTFGPTGPVLVSTDLLADRDDLRVTTAVNGEVRQDGRTSDMIFDVPTLISFLSHITTLCTGDLIFTGTPEGVGVAQGRFLADGDVITTTIEGIGTMTNRCVRVSDAMRFGQ